MFILDKQPKNLSTELYQAKGGNKHKNSTTIFFSPINAIVSVHYVFGHLLRIEKRITIATVTNLVVYVERLSLFLSLFIVFISCQIEPLESNKMQSYLKIIDMLCMTRTVLFVHTIIKYSSITKEKRREKTMVFSKTKKSRELNHLSHSISSPRQYVQKTSKMQFNHEIA